MMRFASLLVFMALLGSSMADLKGRFAGRVERLTETLAKEQGAVEPVIFPIFGPDDVATDGTMAGNDALWIERVIKIREKDPGTYPMRRSENPYSIQIAVYNLKNPRVYKALLKAYKAGIVVQIIVDYSKTKSRRFKVDDEFEAVGMPIFKDRKEIPEGFDLEAPLFTGVKVSSLMHNKMRILRWPGDKVLLTGSLNPGVESMENDESLYAITDERIIERYSSFFDRLLLADRKLNEKSWVNTWDNNQGLNVLFSPSKQGFDIGEKILDWIDEEKEFLFITVFSLNLFSGKRSGRHLISALEKAHKRGVEIWVVTDRKQSDGHSGFGRPVDDMIRKISPEIVMYEVLNEAGMFNAMHLKDAIFGLSQPKLLTDTSNWSNAAFGSCYSSKGGVVTLKRSCSKESSSESSLFVDSKHLKGGKHFVMRVLRHHLTLLDKYYRQIPIQGTDEPTPDQAWQRLQSRFGNDLTFQRTTVLVNLETRPGEFVEMRGAVCKGDKCEQEAELEYINKLNLDSLPLKQSWRWLSWEHGAALDWTCSPELSGNQYMNNGFGGDVDSKGRGRNWWKFLAYVDGKKGDWFEFKLVKTKGIAGDVLQWEQDVRDEQLEIVDSAGAPAGTDGRPTASKNHQGRLGYITRTTFNAGSGRGRAPRT